MSWLPKWILKRPESSEEGPNVRFGRQFTLFTTPEKAAVWDNSLSSFEQGEYLDSIASLLEYLSYDPGENVQWERTETEINFSIRQGSKVVFGHANDKRVRIEAPVAHVRVPSIGLWRKLLELNYLLNYSRYALDNANNISLRFDSFSLDGSPFKLYAALKEVALNADKEDDLMVEDFKGTEAVHNRHIVQLPEAEKAVKLKYLRNGIKSCLELVKDPELNSSLHAGGMAYIILDSVYRMDYLTRPEGKTMVSFEEIQKSFFAGEAQPAAGKIREAVALLEKLDQREDQDFLNELYFVPRTFSVLQEVTMDVIRAMWISESTHIDWYIENKQFRIAKAITGYALGYAVFNYALGPVYIELIHLLYRIQEFDYFRDLGYFEDFDSKNERSYKQKVVHMTKKILTENGLDSRLADQLDFSNDATFARSFLLMIILINETT